MSDYQLAGVDLAWVTDNNPTAIAFGTLIGNEIRLESISENLYGLDVISKGITSMQNLHGVAVDAPLIIENLTGQRVCEKRLGRAYSAKKAACHAANLSRYPNADSVLLGRDLEQFGFQHLADPAEKWQLECYPHPALIEIFRLKERHLYKKGFVAEKQKGQCQLSQMLISLQRSKILKLTVPSELGTYFDIDRIKTLRGRMLKHNEDVLDAIICLYIAGLYQLGYRDRVFGDTHNGYIYVPQQVCI